MVRLGVALNKGRRAGDYVFLWVTNAGAAKITANSVASLCRAGVADPERLLVAALDDEAAEIVARLVPNARIFPLGEAEQWLRLALGGDKGYREYGSRSFNVACLARYIAIDHVLEKYGRPVVYADGDIVYLRDPASYLSRLQPRFRNLVLAQNDRHAGCVGGDWSRQYRAGTRPDASVICSGFTVWLPVREHRRMAEAVVGSILCEGNMPVDQEVFNRLGQRWLRHVMLLRQDLFPNGSLWLDNDYLIRTVEDRPAVDWSQAFIAHANHTVGMENKMTAIAEAGFWFLGDD